ncbi:hypothetical protein E2C01_030431 [Portunus trituberculatus]|uniref:Uncharacterized protein n=1 Tax=Portunus trituberculatus TaxID=210409 RepID=A0A5B7EVA7_PORTR|nr:hypothetical protein [Portunus trituberculatus]
MAQRLTPTPRIALKAFGEPSITLMVPRHAEILSLVSPFSQSNKLMSLAVRETQVLGPGTTRYDGGSGGGGGGSGGGGDAVVTQVEEEV